MKKYILITLSRNSIILRSGGETDSPRGLMSWSGGEHPLAVFSHGSEFEVGKNADDALHRGAEGAYGNLFALLHTEGTFNYQGNQRSLRDMLGLAALHCGQEIAGDDEPVYAISFGPDVTADERKCALESLMRAGFNEIREIDTEKHLEHTLTQMLHHPGAVILTSDGTDLYARMIKGKGASYSYDCLRNVGDDPRVPRAMNKIKEDILADDPYLEITHHEEKVIEKAAVAFVRSGARSVNSSVVIHGERYSYYITAVRVAQHDEQSADLKRRIGEWLDEKGVTRQSVSLIMRGERICTDYFREALNSLVPEIIEISDQIEDKVLLSILDEMSQPITSSSDSKPEATIASPTEEKSSAPSPTASPTASHTPPSPPSPPKKDWNRIWRTEKARLKAAANAGRKEYASDEMRALLTELHAAGIHNYDSEAETLIDEWKEKIAEPAPSSATAIPAPASDSDEIKSLRKEFKRVKISAKASHSAGKLVTAAQCVVNFRTKCEKAGVHEFDGEIKELMAIYMPAAAPAKPATPKTTAPKLTKNVSAPKPPQKAATCNAAPAQPIRAAATTMSAPLTGNNIVPPPAPGGMTTSINQMMPPPPPLAPAGSMRATAPVAPPKVLKAPGVMPAKGIGPTKKIKSEPTPPPIPTPPPMPSAKQTSKRGSTPFDPSHIDALNEEQLLMAKDAFKRERKVGKVGEVLMMNNLRRHVAYTPDDVKHMSKLKVRSVVDAIAQFEQYCKSTGIPVPASFDPLKKALAAKK